MAVNITGTLIVVFYYIAIVSVGVWKGRKARPPVSLTRKKSDVPDDYLPTLYAANRSVYFSLGLASMTATSVGGGYINGTAEAVFNYGLIWGHASLGSALSLVVGGSLFAGKMRATNALTMLDPLQQRYGTWIAVPLIVPAILGELFRTASALAALGDTMSLVIQVNSNITIVLTACIIILYTSLGSLFSVLYTDVLQVTTTVIGLWICVPFVMRNSAGARVEVPFKDFMGRVGATDVSQILDQFSTAIFGGISWQVYFQIVLSAQTAFTAKMLSYLSAVGCLVLAVPPVVIGATGKKTNFTAFGYPGPFNLLEEHRKDVLPYAIFHMTPQLVSVMGQLGITAAVMSSVDSSMLSASSLISRNIFHLIFKPSATDSQVSLVLRLMLILVGTVATLLALSVRSVFTLWTLSSDLAYVLLFPQFVAFFHLNSFTNAYGAVSGFVVGFATRALCGEPGLGVPALVRLPMYDAQRGQQFPFRTLCMLLGLGSLVFTSQLTFFAFRANLLPRSLDIWQCCSDAPSQGIRVEGEAANLPGSAQRTTPVARTPKTAPSMSMTPNQDALSRTPPDAALPEALADGGKGNVKKNMELTESCPGSAVLAVGGTIGASTPVTGASTATTGAGTPATIGGTSATIATSSGKTTPLGKALSKAILKSPARTDLSQGSSGSTAVKRDRNRKRSISSKQRRKNSRVFLGL
ncbi:hypothetical protein HPB48_006290 [Haemaphysalis longicornis]|uniref:Sodium/solute symporter n=1 Tax=Haemaphysalis longicornis TaxID=44386 RepID=A0A9J6GQB7_HAELO|nr:hypothetical protein HPB48_006290 [Haemaphysalis longicornis]